MALLLASNGVHVCLNDPSEDSLNQVSSNAEADNLQSRLSKHKDYESLCNALDQPKVFFFSLPHGTVGDKVVEGLKPVSTSSSSVF